VISKSFVTSEPPLLLFFGILGFCSWRDTLALTLSACNT